MTIPNNAIRAICFWMLMLPLVAGAQETLLPLTSNPVVAKAHAERNYYGSNRAQRSGDTLSLPFVDDFSNFSSPFPDTSKWTNNSAYINGHMAVKPISIGVATFDGVNANGLPYSFSPLDPQGPADTLTSRHLNLEGATDTVYLSFYYQAQGMGNAPEHKDSLIVQLKDTADIWHTVLKLQGYNLEDSLFRSAFIPIIGAEYLYKGFQFQFLNYATLSGNVDHWHIDYVRLDDGLTLADTVVNDYSFVYNQLSIHQEYQSVPWPHYDIAQCRTTQFFEMVNNFDINKKVFNKFRVMDYSGTVIFNSTNQSSPNVNANTYCNNVIDGSCASGDVNEKFSNSTEDFVYPLASQINADSSQFTFQNIFVHDDNDAIAQNDTINLLQKFYNYYAYDDGTAENGWGILDVPLAHFAYAFNFYEADVLRGLQIYFNPILDDAALQRFKIKVWTGAQVPSELIYESDWMVPAYGYARDYFVHYLLTEPLNVPSGLVFIGLQQETGQMLNVGLDRTINSNYRMYYNLGEDWAQSSIPGSWMIRPTVGAAYTWTGAEEVVRISSTINVYPNPSNGLVKFTGTQSGDRVEVFDMTGRLLQASTLLDSSLDLSYLRSGFYLVKASRNGQHLGTTRLVIQ